MAEDSFIREVNEELRQERAQALWGRYGSLVIILAIIIVAATAAYQAFGYWQTKKAAKMGDNYLQAMSLADADKFKEALALLEKTDKNGYGNYSALSQLRIAAIKDEQGDRAAAVAIFDRVANNRSVPEILQKVARIRAGYILVDAGSVGDVEQRVKPLATDIDPLRFAAREALGLAEWKAGNNKQAIYYFNKNKDEGPSGVSAADRAKMMLDLIAGQSAMPQ